MVLTINVVVLSNNDMVLSDHVIVLRNEASKLESIDYLLAVLYV